jgi:hypothetical protein
MPLSRSALSMLFRELGDLLSMDSQGRPCERPLATCRHATVVAAAPASPSMTSCKGRIGQEEPLRLSGGVSTTARACLTVHAGSHRSRAARTSQLW